MHILSYVLYGLLTVAAVYFTLGVAVVILFFMQSPLQLYPIWLLLLYWPWFLWP